MKAGLVVCKDLHAESLLVKYISNRCILHSGVLVEVFCLAVLTCIGCTLHQLVDIGTGYGDGKKSYSREYGETSSYIIGYDESLVAFLGSKCL